MHNTLPRPSKSKNNRAARSVACATALLWAGLAGLDVHAVLKAWGDRLDTVEKMQKWRQKCRKCRAKILWGAKICVSDSDWRKESIGEISAHFDAFFASYGRFELGHVFGRFQLFCKNS